MRSFGDLVKTGHSGVPHSGTIKEIDEMLELTAIVGSRYTGADQGCFPLFKTE